MRQKKTSLDDGDNDDWKYILMGILNVLLLKLILCIYSCSFLKKLKHTILFSHSNWLQNELMDSYILLTHKGFTFYNKNQIYITNLVD